MAHFLLIHGAWHGAWCWSAVTPFLQNAGHTAHALDLPGRGMDRAPHALVTMDHFVGAIVAVLEAATEPMVLVAHSMGGVIAEVAERLPGKLQALVYIAATIPANGRSLMDVVAELSGEWTSQFQMSEDGWSVTLLPGAARRFLYSEAPEDTAQWADRQLCPEPIAPARTPISTTAARFGSVPSYYVACLQDLVVPLALQRKMALSGHCRRVYELNTDHSPFLSRPAELAECLISIANHSCPDPAA